jgi:beta-lactamase regulating signal transducer with metallopeptidase domain
LLTALLALPLAPVLLPELRMPGLPALDQKISQWLRADANGPAMSVPGQAHVVMDEQNLIRITPSNILRVVPDTRAPSTTPPVGSVSLWILLFYTLGVCLVVRRIHESTRSMQHMQETILSDRRSRLNDRLYLWTARMGIKRPIAIGFSEAVTVPALAGLKHPCILIPVTMFQASEEKLDAVIAHGLAHGARQDLRWTFIVQILRILYWFHPLVHLVYRRFLDAREEVCDEMAVAVLGNMRRDATTLLDVAAPLTALPDHGCARHGTDAPRARSRRTYPDHGWPYPA